MTGRLRQPLWIAPLAIAGLVALFGWWANNRLREIIEEQLRSDLTATLEANVTALEIWTTNQAKLATSLADEPKVRSLALQLLDEVDRSGGDTRKIMELPQLEELESHLRSRLNGVGYEIGQLVTTNFVIVANSRRGRMRLGGSVSEAHLVKFAELFASGQPVIITPFKPRRPPPPRGPGEMESGRPFPNVRGVRPWVTNNFQRGDRPPPLPDSFRNRRGDITLMQVAAPIRDQSGPVRGALALIINPDTEFSRILSVARRGKSGETYAFDQHGLMISRSRFDDQLKRIGLIEGRPGASSALTVRLTDPGRDLTEGFSRAISNSAARPLIRMVANAVAGRAGVEVQPSRDYRGVPVIGAWRWLPQHGFGVSTQIDAQEAYRPLRVLKLIFIILFLLLVLSANGIFVFSYLNSVWRRRLNEAELKVKQLGQYTLEEKIGEGGMGVVYRARHALMRRDTAVKLLLPDRADAASVRRFEHEVRLTCQLTHPNTIQVYDYGHTPEGVFYYAMEFLRGLNLHELVAQFGPQPEGRVVHILTQICDALAEAHSLGLVHRDIKPSNVFLCSRGGVPDWVKVLDFGLVREYRDGNGDQIQAKGDKEMIGTPSFMPPEAINDSARSGPAGDIYSVGALGYYLMTGEYVFAAESLRELRNKHLTQSRIPPSQRTTNPISPELEKTIMRCLEREPNSRPQSASELRALLLTSPRASEWGPVKSADWWVQFDNKSGRNSSTSNGEPTADDSQVKIDFVHRNNGRSDRNDNPSQGFARPHDG